MVRHLLVVPALALSLSSGPAGPHATGTDLPRVAPPADGRALVREMHARYATTWYRTLTFVQTTRFADGRVETWYESAAIPGRLRIDIAPLDSGRTILFRADTVHEFRGGTLAGSAPLVHPLMVLGFDVYADPPETTIRKLEGLGVDLGTLRAATWQGRAAWVVGAADGDTTSAQFWVDRERLLFVRLIEPKRPPDRPDAAPRIQETQFNRYERLGGGWIAPEVLFLVNGREVLREEYGEMRADPALDPAIFDPAANAVPEWVRHAAAR